MEAELLVKKVELLVCDKPTQVTGRTYPKELVIKALERFKESGAYAPILGQFTEPNDYNISEIDFSKVSHAVTDLEWKNNVLCGTLNILDTSQGRIAFELFKQVDVTALALLGTGMVDDKNVVTDLEIISFNLPDFVNLLERKKKK